MLRSAEARYPLFFFITFPSSCPRSRGSHKLFIRISESASVVPKTTWSAFTSPAISYRSPSLPRVSWPPRCWYLGLEQFFAVGSSSAHCEIVNSVLASIRRMPRATLHPHPRCDNDPRLQAVPSVWELRTHPCLAWLCWTPRCPQSPRDTPLPTPCDSVRPAAYGVIHS